MKRFLFLFSVFALLAAPAAAGDDLWDEPAAPGVREAALQELPVALRENSVVDDEYIRLGDLFGGLDDTLDGTPVSRAPALGKDVVLTADWLAKAAKRYGIRWTPENENVRITVTRAAKEVSRDEILEAFRKELLVQGMPKTARIMLDKNRFSVVLPVDAAYEITVEKTTYTPATYAVSGIALIASNGKTVEKIELNGKAIPFVNVPLAQRSLSAGQIITESDVAVKPMREDILRNEAPARLEDLIGKEVKRGVRAGQVLSDDDVRTKVMVPKGKIVTLSFTKKGILLSTQGKALENGGLGDTVRVMNTQSKNIVQGTVTGPDTVVIEAPGR